MLLLYFKLCTERYVNCGKEANATINLGSKLIKNNLWAVLDVFPIVAYEELNVSVAKVHYVAIYYEKQYSGASLDLLNVVEERNITWKMCETKLGVTPCY